MSPEVTSESRNAFRRSSKAQPPWTERGLATTIADPALDRVRGFEEQAKLHLAVAIERMHKSVIGERTTRVEVDGMAAARNLSCT